MQHEIHFSLISHLRSVIGVDVIWIFDGVSLPSEDKKPYITVEQMMNSNTILSKGREAIQTVYRFQIGLFAKTSSERARMQGDIKRTLLFDEIGLIDTTQPTTPVVGFFNANVTGEVPISPESIADKSKYHRVYFDVEVPAVMHRKKTN